MILGIHLNMYLNRAKGFLCEGVLKYCAASFKSTGKGFEKCNWFLLRTVSFKPLENLPNPNPHLRIIITKALRLLIQNLPQEPVAKISQGWCF